MDGCQSWAVTRASPEPGSTDGSAHPVSCATVSTQEHHKLVIAGARAQPSRKPWVAGTVEIDEGSPGTPDTRGLSVGICAAHTELDGAAAKRVHEDAKLTPGE